VPKVFISYRRSDSLHVTGRVYDRLASSFGSRSLFRDVDSIPLGERFRQVIEDAVTKCDVLIVIIGENWVDVRDNEGRRRLDSADDYVRLEVASALSSGIPVIPVLIESTAIPSVDQLPADLQELTAANAARVRSDPDFHDDVDKLVRAIKKLDANKSWRADRLIMHCVRTIFALDLALGPLSSFVIVVVSILLLIIILSIVTSM
jgi:TIR domain